MTGWLEQSGRVLSPVSVGMRYALLVAAITAIELGYKEGISVGIAILASGQFLHANLIDRMQTTIEERKDPEDPRPTRLMPGWLAPNGHLLGINPLTFRALMIVVSIVTIQLGNPKVGGFAGLFVLYAGTESAGKLLGRVVDNLVQVEVVRRVAIKMGYATPIGWGENRGDQNHG